MILNVKKAPKLFLGFAALGLLAAGAGVGVHIARANGIPATKALTYVGTLEGTDGQLIEGPHDIALAVWDSGVQGEGTKWCEVPAQSLIVKAGRFELSLPDTCPAGFNDRSDTFLEITVDGESMGRSKVGAVPYAAEADTAGKARVANQAAPGSPLAQTLAAANARIDTAAVADAWADCQVVAMLQEAAALGAAARTAASNTFPAKCRRVGDSLEVMATFLGAGQVPCGTLTSATNNTAGFGVSLGLSVVGFEVDDDKLIRPGFGAPVGSGRIGTGGVTVQRFNVPSVGDTVWDNRVWVYPLSGSTFTDCARPSASAPWTQTVGFPTTTVRFTIPVKGFSATVAP